MSTNESTTETTRETLDQGTDQAVDQAADQGADLVTDQGADQSPVKVDCSSEIWRDIAETTGYQVSNLGDVMGRRGKLLTPHVNQFGYKTVSPLVAGRAAYRQVHRLVAIAFIPNPGKLPLVNHIDGNRLNNRADNLEWVTAKQNAERTVNKAVDSPRRSRKVVQTFPDGHTEIWDSVKDAAAEAAVCDKTMAKWCGDGHTDGKGRTWTFIENAAQADPNERWATAQGVTISNQGRIRLPSGQIVRGRMKGSYLRYQRHGVHRLVAEAFCEKPPGMDIVNHRDGNPQNNKSDNLEWTTQKNNCAHSVATGLSRRYPVKRTRPDGTVTIYPSIQEASRQTRVSAGDIVWVCKGRRKRAGGSVWEYAGESETLPAEALAAIGPEAAHGELSPNSCESASLGNSTLQRETPALAVPISDEEFELLMASMAI